MTKTVIDAVPAVQSDLTQIMATLPAGSIEQYPATYAEFLALLDELDQSRSSRLTFIDGILEVKIPTPKHEIFKKLLDRVITALADDLEIDVKSCGSMTLKNASRTKAANPMNAITCPLRLKSKPRLILIWKPTRHQILLLKLIFRVGRWPRINSTQPMGYRKSGGIVIQLAPLKFFN